MLIPTDRAQIEWNDDDEGRIAEVEVFDRRDLEAREVGRELLSCSSGACMADWLADPRSTPEGVYAGWVLSGFLDAATHRQALEQLGKIEDCAWARNMAAAMALLAPEDPR